MKKQVRDVIVTAILRYIKQEFPTNAKSWRQATDEITSIGSELLSNVVEFRGRKFAEGMLEKAAEKTKNPAERNKKWHKIIKFCLNYVRDNELRFIVNRHGHWFLNSKDKELISGEFPSKLFENQQLDTLMPANLKEKELEFMSNKAHQFELECGIILENLVDPRVPEMQISLKYWVNNSLNFDTFIQKLGEYVSLMDGELTQNDIDKLKTHVNKWLAKHK